MINRQYYVYILANNTNVALYLGVTNDLKKRVYQHKQQVVRGFAERYGIELKNFFKDLPSGVSLLPDYKPVEEIHKEAKGIELYAPEHDYKVSAEGTVEGPLPEIIGLYEQAKEKDLIKLKEITLHFE